MEEFEKSINEFLEFRKYDILKDNGKISRKQAEEKAEKEYNEFNKNQKITSDFDKLLLEANRINKKIIKNTRRLYIIATKTDKLIDNYDEEIIDGDLHCIDMYYYSKDLKRKMNDN